MKKSEIYKLAQCAVLESITLDTYTKLDILHELISDENLALFAEKQNEKESEVAI